MSMQFECIRAKPAQTPFRSVVAAVVVGIALLGCADSPLASHTEGDSVPRALSIPSAAGFSDLAVGNKGYCVLADGVAKCVGNKQDEEAAGTHAAHDGGVFTKLTGQLWFTCGLTSLGNATCWAESRYPLPTQLVPSTGRFVDISGNCALRDDGVIECFRGDERLVLTATAGRFMRPLFSVVHEACGLRDDGVVECVGPKVAGVPLTIEAEVGRFVEVSSDGRKFCAVRDDGALECWKVTDVDEAPWVHRTLVPSSSRFVNASAAGFCGLRLDGKIECGEWEKDEEVGARGSRNGLPFIQVHSGDNVRCGRRADGAVECWDYWAPGGSLVLPTAQFQFPSRAIVGTDLRVTLSNATIAGAPEETHFEYRFYVCGQFTTRSTQNFAECRVPNVSELYVEGRVYDRFGDRSSYQATIPVSTSEQAASDLRSEIGTAELSPDLRKPLTVKLDAAIAAIAAGNTAKACSSLADFMNQVRAQRGKAIPEAMADAWLQQATDLRRAIGC